MKKFYTFVGLCGNKIYHTYYENNERHRECIDEYNYTLYVESQKPNCEMISLERRPLNQIEFTTPREMTDFFRENKDLMRIHGNESAVHQFIAKEYNYDPKQSNPISILNFDIEVEHGNGFTKYDNYYIVSAKDENGVETKETILTVKRNPGLKVFCPEKNDWVEFKQSMYGPENIGFPKETLANQEVMSISIKKFGKNETMFSLGTKDLDEYDNPNGVYIKCGDEKDLLLKFIEKWKEIDPDIVTGWNVHFDVTYMVNRIKKVLGELYASELSPFFGQVYRSSDLIKERRIGNKKEEDDKVEYDIFGIAIYDYLELYKKYNMSKQESYKLDFIGQVEIGQKKVDFTEYGKSLMRLYEGDITVDLKTPFEKLDEVMKYARLREVIRLTLKNRGYDIEKTGLKNIGTNVFKFNIDEIDLDTDNETLKGMYNYTDERVKTLSYKKFITYNEQDANIVELLDNKMTFIKLALRVAHVSKSAPKEIFGTVKPWDNMIYARLLSKNVQIPPHIVNDKDAKFAGAYVKDPIPGYYKNVATVDLKSLYPSLSIQGNMSPETMIKHRDDKPFETRDKLIEMTYDTSIARQKGYVTVGNGAVFHQEFQGVIPETMQFLMDERDAVKKHMKAQDRILQDVKREIQKRQNM